MGYCPLCGGPLWRASSAAVERHRPSRREDRGPRVWGCTRRAHRPQDPNLEASGADAGDPARAPGRSPPNVARGRGGRPSVRTGERREPFHAASLYRRADRAWDAAGITERLRLHQARHTYASFMIAAGVNAKALATYMGHSSIKITFDLYGHLMPGSEAEAADLLEHLSPGGGDFGDVTRLQAGIGSTR